MINIYHRFIELDNRHEYGIASTHGNTIFFTWIWFYLGQSKLGKMKSKIWFIPFKGYGHEKIIKSYKEIHEAKRLAEWISNAIIKHYNKRKQ